MLNLLVLVPVLPLAGFAVLALFGTRFSRKGVAWIGVGSVALSAIVALVVAGRFISAPPEGYAWVQELWTWMDVEGLRPGIALYLDPLSLVMVLVVTFVGFLIHLYSVEFMIDDEGYSRFFAYMNLFVASMLTLLLGDNLLLLYLGWEGVGLCSYLLIGFWYRDPINGLAARKAFVVTRVGDTAMALGLFLIFTQLGSLRIQDLMDRALHQWPIGSGMATAAAAFLLGGAVGKSAQLPLQTWLPDAMAGPTPTSALIHAATMVTAGVYLIARTYTLFLLSPPVMLAVAVVGAATLLLASFSALTQRDIKRVLAYSTISQIGYMFLALGVGAWSAAIFHFMTHAFFKALLFLAAGAVILAMHHEHDLFKMGGLRKQLPLVFWTFLAGAASLAAVPMVTAGFYSKDAILTDAWFSPYGGVGLWLAGLVGALVTAIYTFRLVFLTFFGPAHGHVASKPGLAMSVPLVILAVLSILGGLVDLPHWLADFPVLSDFLQQSFRFPVAGTSAATSTAHTATEGALVLGAGLASLLGIYLAYAWFLVRPQSVDELVRTPLGGKLHRFWFAGWGFDWLYDRLLVRPFVWLAEVDRQDVIDQFYAGVAAVSDWLHRALRGTENGMVRWYALGIAAGAALVLAIVVLWFAWSALPVAAASAREVVP